jgi:hypothetical protein
MRSWRLIWLGLVLVPRLLAQQPVTQHKASQETLLLWEFDTGG